MGGACPTTIEAVQIPQYLEFSSSFSGKSGGELEIEYTMVMIYQLMEKLNRVKSALTKLSRKDPMLLKCRIHRLRKSYIIVRIGYN